MNAAPPTLEPADPGPADPGADPGTDPGTEAARQRTDRHLKMLAELAELSMELARALQERAITQTAEAAAGLPAEPGPDAVLQFTRMARTVRETVALEARLAEPREKRHEKRRAAPAREAPAADERTENRKSQILDGVLRAIIASGGDGPENWVSELKEKLEDDAEDPDQGDVAEVIVQICCDLGIDPDATQARADGTEPSGRWSEAGCRALASLALGLAAQCRPASGPGPP